MKDRLDPLISERAPWLFTGHRHHTAALWILTALLGYRETVSLAEALETLPTETILARMTDLVARDVEATGIDHLPASGPALIVANHPTGIADGIVLWSLIAARRPDLYVYANRDILRVLPQMESLIVPVEWRPEKRSHAKTRATMDLTRSAIEAGRIGVIFPSGRLAKRTGLKLMERPWMPSAAMLARKYGLPVIPVNIRARNSALFYLFDLIHPTLRDITLFHETLNKGRQPFRVTFGRPIAGDALPKRAEDGIELLRAATLSLGGKAAPAVSLVQATRRPGWLQGAMRKTTTPA